MKDDLVRFSKTYGSVSLTGGEPTIRLDFMEILSFCSGIFNKVSIQTNGRRFSDMDFARAVCATGTNISVFLSFHSHKKVLHEKLSGSSGSFDQSVLGIKNLVSLGCNLGINVVVMEQNYRELGDTVSFLNGLGVNEIEFSFIHPNGRAWRNRKMLVPRIEDTLEHIKKAIDTAKVLKMRAFTERYPICFLGEYRSHATETMFGGSVGNRILVFKPECNNCIRKHECSGFWETYLDMFDVNLSPVLKE